MAAWLAAWLGLAPLQSAVTEEESLRFDFRGGETVAFKAADSDFKLVIGEGASPRFEEGGVYFDEAGLLQGGRIPSDFLESVASSGSFSLEAWVWQKHSPERRNRKSGETPVVLRFRCLLP